ncbi:MAG: hypothetical protein JXA20_12170 [Spirochaetes bacterium]|nr:hypothetical protein [Spirochaetota bacterium]
MHKMVFILRGERTEPVNSFRHRVLDRFIPRLLEGTAVRCKATLTAADPPRLSITPYRKERVALVSLWDGFFAGPSWAERVRNAWEGPCYGYRVEESIPLSYDRDWPPGTQTPGLGLLTLFRSRRGLCRHDFIRMWHEGHTPLGMQVHPLWNYVRNVVAAPIIPDSPELGGIVEEHFRCPGDLLDPVRFFGGFPAMIPNMVRIALDIRRWMDLGSIENYLVTEHWLDAPPRTLPAIDWEQ